MTKIRADRVVVELKRSELGDFWEVETVVDGDLAQYGTAPTFWGAFDLAAWVFQDGKSGDSEYDVD